MREMLGSIPSTVEEKGVGGGTKSEQVVEAPSIHRLGRVTDSSHRVNLVLRLDQTT
jgi:hypothetical protein